MQEVYSPGSWSKEVLTNPQFLGMLLKRELLIIKFDYQHLDVNKLLETEDGQKLFLPTPLLPVVEKLHVLTNQTHAQIFLFTLMHSPVYPGEIANFLHKHKQAIHYNIQKLRSAGLVEEHREIDHQVLAIIQKKARSRQDGTRKLSFYRIATMDLSLLATCTQLALEVTGLEEARRIAAYTRSFSKPDYRIHEAVQHLLKFKDPRKREIALLEWSRDLRIPVERLKEELRRAEGLG